MFGFALPSGPLTAIFFLPNSRCAAHAVIAAVHVTEYRVLYRAACADGAAHAACSRQ